MKKINHFASIASLRLPALTLLGVTMTLLALAPVPVRAGEPAPFHSSFITDVTTFVEFPILHVTVDGRGKATYMGMAKAFTDDQIVNLVDGSGSATYTLTANNGDTLVVSLVVPVGGTINVDGGVIFSGTYSITGGTGRFTGATGNGVFAGSGLFFTETDGIGAFAMVGNISR